LNESEQTMIRPTKPEEKNGADSMTHTVTCKTFGQPIAPRQPTELARRIAGSIGDSTPVAWAVSFYRFWLAPLPPGDVPREDQGGRPQAA
jgi:hypothetical protein